MQSNQFKGLRDHYFIPEENGKEVTYFCGNSLGLQPKSVNEKIQQELEDWKNLAVEGHFNAQNPWFKYHHFFEGEANLVGAKAKEVVLMNSLTVNLHLMMVSFYQPQGKRYKIIMEGGAFPSDQYAVESQVKFHGYDYKDAVIEVMPRAGEHCLRTEDIEEKINEHRDELALALFSGVNYYTGQYFDIPAITSAAHEAGAMAGFDLAHAAGNLPMNLHDWNVDFAVWCTYKYLNSGPGSVSGVFVHEKHGKNQDLPRFAGWWGNDENERFQICNIPNVKVITPENSKERGCQLSILTGANGKKVFDKMREAGIIADWREPNVIRVAPVPMYNTFDEVDQFAEFLKQINA